MIYAEFNVYTNFNDTQHDIIANLTEAQHKYGVVVKGPALMEINAKL